jgi:hypothetical protein
MTERGGITHNYITEQQIPKSREELVARCYLAIIESNKSLNTKEKIDAIKTFITAALPDIPESEYNPKTPHIMEPKREDIQKRYLALNPLLVPELMYSKGPELERWRQEEYLNLLQIEFSKVMILLSKNTNWAFTKTTLQNQA